MLRGRTQGYTTAAEFLKYGHKVRQTQSAGGADFRRSALPV
jgi:hypothetical protein